MKTRGIVRKIDDLGRIVIPKEIRKTMNINNSDLLDIYINEDGVCIKKYVSKNDYKEYIIILKDTIPAELSLKNKQLILQKLTDVLHILEKH